MFHQIMRVFLLGQRSHMLKARWCRGGLEWTDMGNTECPCPLNNNQSLL